MSLSSFGNYNNMETHFHLRRSSSSLFLILLLLFIISFHYTIGSVGEEEEEQLQQQQQQLHVEEDKNKPPIIETVKRLFSFPTSFPQTSTSSYWTKLQSLITQGKAYFSPPTVDFRDSKEAQGRDEGGGAAAGEKVKEAVLKSLDKSKATIEESAKSAAKLAGDAMQKTTNKLKRTFSFGDGHPEHQADEL